MLQPRAPLYTARRAKLPLLLAAAAVVLCVFVLRAARHSGEKSAAGEPLQKQRQAAGLQPPALQAAAASSKWPKVKASFMTLRAGAIANHLFPPPPPAAAACCPL